MWFGLSFTDMRKRKMYSQNVSGGKGENVRTEGGTGDLGYGTHPDRRAGHPFYLGGTQKTPGIRNRNQKQEAAKPKRDGCISNTH